MSTLLSTVGVNFWCKLLVRLKPFHPNIALLFSATCRCKILEECPAPLLKMKRQEFRSWREVVVCVPGKQGHSILVLHVAAMDRNVDGPVVCSTTVIAQKGRRWSVLWQTSGGLNRCGSRPIMKTRSKEISRSCEVMSANWQQKSCGILRFLIPQIGFKNKLWSQLRRFHRSVLNSAPSNGMCVCQSLLFRSK